MWRVDDIYLSSTESAHSPHILFWVLRTQESRGKSAPRRRGSFRACDGGLRALPLGGIASSHQSRCDSLIGPAGPGPSFVERGWAELLIYTGLPFDHVNAQKHFHIHQPSPAQVIEVRRHHRRRRGQMGPASAVRPLDLSSFGGNGLTLVLARSAEVDGVLILRFYQIRNMACPRL